MRFREGDPDMTWQEARLQIGAAEGAIALLLFAKPAYEARLERERVEAWQARREERERFTAVIKAMPLTTEAEFRAVVEAIALYKSPWLEASVRPILHCMWSEDRVVLCDGVNTAGWLFDSWSEWTSVEQFCGELMGAVRDVGRVSDEGADWNCECEEHGLWSE